MPSIGKPKTIGRKKTYWLEAQGDLLRRIPLSNAETFDYNQVYELVPKVLTEKPIARCKARCTSDAIKLKKASTFGAQPPRKVYLYKDIERFYSFANNPGILILGCIDPEKRTRNYEFFKFEEQNVQEIGGFINRARSHPMCILVDDENTPDRYQSSQSSLVGESEVRGDLTESRGEDEERRSIEPPPNMTNSDRTGEQNEVISVGHTDEILEQAIRVITTDAEQEQREEEETQPTEYSAPQDDKKPSPIPSHLLSDPLFRTFCEHIDEDDIWAVDLKYVDHHPKYGNQIDRSGGTYLFVAHHKYPEHVSDQSPVPSDYDVENTAETAFTVSYFHC